MPAYSIKQCLHFDSSQCQLDVNIPLPSDIHESFQLTTDHASTSSQHPHVVTATIEAYLSSISIDSLDRSPIVLPAQTEQIQLVKAEHTE